ncbi:hypothetical protein TNCV_1666821 [Trichonephila clavipes]|nr:hypothetical protein TNCV_1666821 [Trichonephila clavipes]
MGITLTRSKYHGNVSLVSKNARAENGSLLQRNSLHSSKIVARQAILLRVNKEKVGPHGKSQLTFTYTSPGCADCCKPMGLEQEHVANLRSAGGIAFIYYFQVAPPHYRLRYYISIVLIHIARAECQI